MYVHKDIYYKEVINFTIIQRIYSILTELGWMRVKYLLGEGEGGEKGVRENRIRKN